MRRVGRATAGDVNSLETQRLISMRSVRTQVVLAGLAVALLFPFPTVVVPAWTVRIVNHLGVPVTNVKIRQHWCHYSFEREGHEADAVPDSDGHVSFPIRRVWAGALQRVVGPMWNLVTAGAHASFGPRAAIQAWGNGYEGWVNYRDPPDAVTLLVAKKST